MPNATDPRRTFTEAYVARDRMGQLFGARFVSLTDDACVYEYDAREEHFNPGGILHGGALYAVMDSSQGMLVHAVLQTSGQTAATGTATIKYLAPVRSGTVTIRTTLVKQEGRKLFIHSDALDDKGASVAVLDEVWITFVPR